MGGSSKPADPKVTPFVEPAAPSNPVPNWFANKGTASGNAFAPDFSQSAKAFGGSTPATSAPPLNIPNMPAAQPAQAMPTQQPTMQAPAAQTASQAPAQPVMPFSIPTQPSFGNFSQFMPPQMMQAFEQMRGMFPQLGGQFQPRYRNYTDTDPAQSTDPLGNLRANNSYVPPAMGSIWDMFPRNPAGTAPAPVQAAEELAPRPVLPAYTGNQNLFRGQ